MHDNQSLLREKTSKKALVGYKYSYLQESNGTLEELEELENELQSILHVSPKDMYPVEGLEYGPIM